MNESGFNDSLPQLAFLTLASGSDALSSEGLLLVGTAFVLYPVRAAHLLSAEAST